MSATCTLLTPRTIYGKLIKLSYFEFAIKLDLRLAIVSSSRRTDARYTAYIVYIIAKIDDEGPDIVVKELG